MSSISKPRPAFKIWLETDEGFVFGPGVYGLLKKVQETGTLKESAKALGMSYRFAWGLLRKAEERLGQPLVKSHKGGRAGGGGVELTQVGHQFIEDFSTLELLVRELSSETITPDKVQMVSRVKANVVGVHKVGERTDLTLLITEPYRLELSLPNTALQGLDISPGDTLNLELTSVIQKIEKPDG
ncbi:MAG: LysR family transcriptional regulator [Candidatus Bathyarchaeota archaeon]|nr:MAG: LysR family transcriptional regulator [Candidatus Bathyarchaeota archaeon]